MVSMWPWIQMRIYDITASSGLDEEAVNHLLLTLVLDTSFRKVTLSYRHDI